MSKAIMATPRSKDLMLCSAVILTHAVSGSVICHVVPGETHITDRLCRPMCNCCLSRSYYGQRKNKEELNTKPTGLLGKGSRNGGVETTLGSQARLHGFGADIGARGVGRDYIGAELQALEYPCPKSLKDLHLPHNFILTAEGQKGKNICRGTTE